MGFQLVCMMRLLLFVTEGICRSLPYRELPVARNTAPLTMVTTETYTYTSPPPPVHRERQMIEHFRFRLPFSGSLYTI